MPTTPAKMKRQKTRRVGEDVEPMELLYIADGSINQNHYFGNMFGNIS